MVARLAALLLAAALTGCAAAPSTAPGAPQRDRPPGGFAAVLHDETGSRSGGLVTWTTSWELTWEEVAGAASYAVWYATLEGTAPARTSWTRPGCGCRWRRGPPPRRTGPCAATRS